MELLLEKTNNLVLDGVRCTLRYALLAQPMEDLTRYGVAVSNETTGERVLIRDTVLNRAEAEKLFAHVAAGDVTPLTLRDVVEDYVADH